MSVPLRKVWEQGIAGRFEVFGGSLRARHPSPMPTYPRNSCYQVRRYERFFLYMVCKAAAHYGSFTNWHSRVPESRFKILVDPKQDQALAQRSDAEHLRQHMEEKYGTARFVFRPGDETWRALVGMEPTFERASTLAQQIEREAGPAFVVLAD